MTCGRGGYSTFSVSTFTTAAAAAAAAAAAFIPLSHLDPPKTGGHPFLFIYLFIYFIHFILFFVSFVSLSFCHCMVYCLLHYNVVYICVVVL